MSSSEARIAADRANAARSTGPRTEEGKAASRRNALKHGLTGSGVVLPELDAAEVDPLPRGPVRSPQIPPMVGGVDLPITVGRRR